MKYAEAFLMKFAMVFVSIFVIFGLVFGVELMEILWISLVITVIGFVGDLLLYPKFGNNLATAGDLVLSFVLLWLLGALWIQNPDFSLVTASILTAILLAAGEWFYHIYLSKRVWNKKETSHTLKHEPKRY
ncbi:MAG TPA: DUF2512 family protein [Planococcus sp. (in: firmicutes)]|nr:DUF2512 family protein [Planococcus sp. (in: firmicutes)]